MDEVATAEFEGRDFDARELVMKYRRRMPLSQLQKSLSSHKTAIRQELIELINEKYSDFVSLSSRMQGVEQALRPLRTPLEESRGLAGSFKDRLGELLTQADSKFQELAEVSARKRQVAAYIDNAKLLQKTKEATASQWANPQEAGDFLRAYTAHENIARDLQRIRLNLSVGGTQETKATAEAEAPAPEPPAAPSPPPAPTDEKSSGFKPPPRMIVADPMPTSPAATTQEAQKKETAASPDTQLASNAGPCDALLEETKAFEAKFVEKLQEQLLGLLEAVKRGWDAAEDPSQRESQLRTELLATASTCRALVTLQRNSVIETVFVKVFVKSSMDTATAACTAAAGAAGADDAQKRQAGAAQGIGTTDLSPFFKVIVESLLAQDSALMWVARRLHCQDDPSLAPFAVPSMHLLSDAVVAPVLAHVQVTWPNVFMPAFPDIFVTNYSQAKEFLSAAEALMLPSERLWLKTSSALLDFRKKWKTQVYFSLRSKEMAQRLDAVINAGDGQNFEQKYVYDGRVFWLRTSVEVVRQLRHIWSDRVYLDVLFPKALRLTLEILARYGAFIKGISESSDASPENAAAPSGVGGKVPHIVSDVLGVLSEVRVAEGSKVEGRATKLILARIPQEEEGIATTEEIKHLKAAACEALQQTAVVMQGPIDSFEAVLVKKVVSAIAPEFAAIRGIPAVYRMTNKPVPTRASPYVESALKPVNNLHESSAPIVAPEVLNAWIVKVVDAAAEHFITQAQQLLDQVQQQEASLARLQKGPTSTDAVTDVNKIHIQLCLDVEIFTKTCEAAPLNITPGTSDGLKKLREVVDSVWSVFEQHRQK